MPWTKNFTDPMALWLGPQTVPEAIPGPGPLIVTGATFMRLWAGMQETRKRKLVGTSVARMPMLMNGVGIGPTGVGSRKKSGTTGPDTNVSISLNMSFYAAVLLSAKLMVISVKIASATSTLWTVSTGVLAVDFNMQARAIVVSDTKYAFLYIKYRGIQLESDSKLTAATGLIDKDTKLVSLEKGLTKANTSALKAAFGLVSNIPGV